ncbi:MAG: carboxymuconolactone decarboxylase family protein [Nanoarchaeota archaeon]|nr:carboxymuconolactone decarboxylase family protein [Nanoarchaeota archaeon]
MHIDHMKKAGVFKKLSGNVGEKYQEWHNAVFDESSPFDKKTMELMALTASAAIKCSYCIESHAEKAKSFGASQEEIAKAIEIASVVGAGSVISYGLEGLDIN